MIVTFNEKKLETGFQTSTPVFFRNRFLGTKAKNQFLRNCGASKHALRVVC
jgi:hypothetical protein